MGTKEIVKDPLSPLQRAVSWIESRLGFKTKVVWYNVFVFVISHVLTLIACYKYGTSVKWQTIIFTYCLFSYGMFGISGGAHRYWAHKSFQASKTLQTILMLAFAMSGSKKIRSWVRDHRVHHKYSDTDADPHNPNRGFFFAHVGCYLMIKHPDVVSKGKDIDMSDIDNDPIARFHDKNFHLLKPLVCFLIPTLIPVMWGEDIGCSLTWQYARYLFLLHVNWSLNSITHVFGDKPYNKNIKATDNSFFKGFLGDEGFHNYHHTFPWDYRTSEFGINHVSISTALIDLAAKLGHAWDLKKPSDRLVHSVARNRGDGSRAVKEISSDYGESVTMIEGGAVADFYK